MLRIERRADYYCALKRGETINPKVKAEALRQHALKSLARRAVAEAVGMGMLLAAVVGSGIVGERLAVFRRVRDEIEGHACATS